MRLSSFFTVTGILLLSGCIPLQQTTSNQSTEINTLKQRMIALEQRSQNPASTADSVQLRNIARQQANLKAELDTLRVDLQSLTGRLEDQQHGIMQLREELTLAQNDLSLRVAALEEAPKQPQTAPVSAPPATTAQPQQPISQPAVTPPPVETPVVEEQPDATTPAATQTADEPEALYHQALQLVQQGTEFSRSRELFRQFIRSYPQHELAVNAMYWIGETLYGDKQYESAILQFQDVIQKYPNHPKMPAALMKQGLAFYALGDVRNAKIILQKVVDNYPQTPEADKAKERLASWQ